MSIKFQPKIIIGSVCGMIASVVGFIAIFFPSLFNLETKKIDEFVMEVKSDDDAKKLFDFLKNHEGRIVKIDIKYLIDGSLYDRKSGVLLDWPPAETVEGSFYDGRIKLENPWIYWKKIDDKSVAEDIGHKLNLEDVYKLADVNRDGYEKGKFGFSPFGTSGLFSVVSDYNLEVHGDYLYRENGGFGFWAKSIKLNKSDLKYSNASDINDLCFQIEILHKSNDNKIYKWGKEQSHGENDQLPNEEHFTGIFFVNPANLSPKYSYMSPKFEWDEVSWAYGERLKAPVTFALDPLTQKELDMKNY